MSTMRSASRAAAVDLLTGYAASAGIKLQIYRARPRSIHAPCAFVDRITEVRALPGIANAQETLSVFVIVVHGPRLPEGGSFDSGVAVDQADAFINGFTDWCDDNVHAIGPNTTLGALEVEDDPTYIPDWVPPNEQVSYFATTIRLEGYAGSRTI